MLPLLRGLLYQSGHSKILPEEDCSCHVLASIIQEHKKNRNAIFSWYDDHFTGGLMKTLQDRLDKCWSFNPAFTQVPYSTLRKWGSDPYSAVKNMRLSYKNILKESGSFEATYASGYMLRIVPERCFITGDCIKIGIESGFEIMDILTMVHSENQGYKVRVTKLDDYKEKSKE